MIFKVIPEEKQLVEEKIEGEILADFERRVKEICSSYLDLLK